MRAPALNLRKAVLSRCSGSIRCCSGRHRHCKWRIWPPEATQDWDRPPATASAARAANRGSDPSAKDRPQVNRLRQQVQQAAKCSPQRDDRHQGTGAGHHRHQGPGSVGEGGSGAQDRFPQGDDQEQPAAFEHAVGVELDMLRAEHPAGQGMGQPGAGQSIAAAPDHQSSRACAGAAAPTRVTA
jgi:hypothetical protein